MSNLKQKFLKWLFEKTRKDLDNLPIPFLIETTNEYETFSISVQTATTLTFELWLKNWKPIHLCWLFYKMGWTIPKYLIGKTTTSTSSSTRSTSSSSSTKSTSSSSSTKSTSSSSSSSTKSTSSSSSSVSTSSSSSSSVSSSSSSSSVSTSSSSSVSSSSSSSSSVSTSSSSSSVSSSSSSSSISTSSSSSSVSSSSSSSSVSSSSSSSTLLPTDKVYSREQSYVLGSTDANLATAFTAQDYIDVSSDNATYVDQSGTAGYEVFEFKNQNDNNTQPINARWEGQTNLAPSTSPVVLQIYNRTLGQWETLKTESTFPLANTDFSIDGVQSANLTDYYDSQFWVAHRVYQLN